MKLHWFLFSFVLFSFQITAASTLELTDCHKTREICATVGFQQEPNSQDEGEFTVTLSPREKVQNVENFEIKLWMDMGNGHGHGSAPVHISQISPGVYAVDNAWFVMVGSWQIRVSFVLDHERIDLVLPVQISTTAASIFRQTPLEDIRKSHFERMNGLCDYAIFSNDQFLVVGLPSHSAIGYGVRVDRLSEDNQTFDLKTADRVMEAKILNQTLYVLTLSSFEGWDIQTRQRLFSYPTHPQLPPNARAKQKATGFILKDHWAVISHGTLGIAILDIQSGHFAKLIPMLSRSNAKDIDVIDAQTAILTIDNDDEGEFTGFYVFDLVKNEIVKQIPLKNPFPTSVRVLDNNRLMDVFFNAIWKFDLKETLQSKEAKPTRIAFRFPGLKSVELYGKVHFDQKYLYACFRHFDVDTDKYSFHTLTYDLDTLKLN